MQRYFTLGSYEITAYYLMGQIAFLAAFLYLYIALRRYERLSLVKVVIFLFLGFFVQSYGGSLLPALYKWHLSGKLSLDHLFKTGQFFHSALVSVIIYAVLYAKFIKFPALRLLDHIAIAACLKSGINRLGCYFHGCCFGKETTLPWGHDFPHSLGSVHPTQLYHFIFELFILLPILFLIMKKRKLNGTIFWSFAFIYSVFRFFIEYIRTNPEFILGHTHAQGFSLLAAILALGVLVFRRKNNKEAA